MIKRVSFRVSDLKKNVEFYQKYLGATIIKNFEDGNFIFLNFLDHFKGTQIAFSDSKKETLVELLEDKSGEKIDVGTGYGHLAFLTEDIYKTCKEIEENGGNVTRKPGPVLGGKTVIAFILDPEGKKIEFIEKKKENWDLRASFNHIMIRVGDLEKSVEFYKSLGMKEIRRSVNSEYKYTLAFIGYDEESTVLELTYNWGTHEYKLGNAFEGITVSSEKDKQVADLNGYKIKFEK